MGNKSSEVFSDHLRALAAPTWEAQHAHPFVHGIGDGTLSLPRFRYWVRQDYVFVIDYVRLLLLGSARAPDVATMARLASLAQATLNVELALHRAYAKSVGVTAAALEREKKSPTCQAYGDFLLRTATLGSYGELIAALLPCMGGFSEIGLRLAKQPPPKQPHLRKWVEMYASPDFAAQGAWCRSLMDAIAKGAPAGERSRLEEAFLISSKYELAFWDMSWNQQKWPV
ncbi:MAG: thiaminase II [Dehalococcoidia bacterium]|nr:thiaminase II [Dehalococcoidia bacterium]